MRIFSGISNRPTESRQCVVTVGNFDGLHLGHRLLIDRAISEAKRRDFFATVLTFWPHPRVYFKPDIEQALFTLDEKLSRASLLGLDEWITEAFTPDFANLDPVEFLERYFKRKLNAGSIVVGEDFCFGRNRTGTLELLSSWCHENQVEVTIIPQRVLGTEKISSSAIRAHLMSGDLRIANEMLGEPFLYSGQVLKGDQRGRVLGFPTANMRLPKEKLKLPKGVYVTQTRVDGKVIRSVTNIGTRPTFMDSTEVLLESHLIDVTVDLYGKTIQVEFLDFIRSEKKFESLEQLKCQISDDLETARQFIY